MVEQIINVTKFLSLNRYSMNQVHFRTSEIQSLVHNFIIPIGEAEFQIISLVGESKKPLLQLSLILKNLRIVYSSHQIVSIVAS